MDTLDISSFDLDDFEGFIDDSFDSSNFHLLNDMCDTWDGDDISLSGEQRVKRKRKTNVSELQEYAKLPRPRIIKSDFRRSFPLIWASVFNSADYDTMMCHINSFYDRDVSVLQRDLRSDISRHSHGNMSCDPKFGHDFLSQFWYRSMRIAPDLVCTLKQTFIKVRSDGTSSIKCTFGLSGTKVITMDGSKILLTDGETAENRRMSCGDPQTEPLLEDKLNRFISESSDLSDSGDLNDSGDSLDGTISVASTDTEVLQEVLQRYLKTSNAMCRRKEQAKNRNLKRRKRVSAETVQDVAVDEWLSASCIAHINNTHDSEALVTTRMLTPEHHPCAITEHAVTKQGTLSQQTEVFKAPFDFTCSLEVNFNVDHRVVSLTLNYLD